VEGCCGADSRANLLSHHTPSLTTQTLPHHTPPNQHLDPPPAQNVKAWPACGGATASIRFSPEIDHAANAGLGGALALLEPVKARYPGVSYADL
jgi:hypothetical protein